jgi:nucleoid DNA-binding protein
VEKKTVDSGTSPDGPETFSEVPSKRRGRLGPSAAPAGRWEIVEAVSRVLDTSRSDAVQIVDGLARVIVELSARHKLVRFPQLGNFRVLETDPREGRNPRTGESVTIPRGKRITFRAAAAFKVALNRSKKTRRSH